VAGHFCLEYKANMKNTPQDPVSMLQALVRCASVTPLDAGALTTVQTWLEDVGFESHRLVFKAVDTPDIDNLFARIGNSGPHLCFAGHTDVVPQGDETIWSQRPFAAEIKDGFLYGRVPRT
jgi:succinyl-diaminopimelate desuccinylase